MQQSCNDVKIMNSSAKDGEYKLWYPKQSVYLKIYCYNMSGNPSEYLTLPAGGASNYIYKGKGDQAYAGSCRGEFSKVRLILTSPVKILRTDTTFMRTTGSKCSPLRSNEIIGYGSAGGCSESRGTTGKFNIDLSGTLYQVPFDLAWQAAGFHPKMEDFRKSSDGKTISASCGGFCGFCNPSTGNHIPLDLPGNWF